MAKRKNKKRRRLGRRSRLRRGHSQLKRGRSQLSGRSRSQLMKWLLTKPVTRYSKLANKPITARSRSLMKWLLTKPVIR